MAVKVIRDGGLTTQDPNDVLTYLFDFDTDNLPSGVTIGSNTFTITQISGASSIPLVKDNESIVDNSRNTQLRLSGGNAGALYKIESQILTSETPPQTKDRHFKLRIEDK